MRFTGYVDDMPALYAAIDVLAAPSRWEGFGLMLVEAMAAGVPIVATAAGAIPEVVGDGPALLVAPDDHDALANAIVQRPRRRRDGGGDGRGRPRARAATFSWERSAERLEAVYDAVLAERA